MQYLKIPKERIAVLIGNRGTVKRDIEARTSTKIVIEETSVTVETTQDSSLSELTAGNMVLAIGRGFSPDTALMLMNEEYTLEVIHLRDYANTPASFERIKSRVIGVNGKARKNIEELSNALVSVYGKTISLIGTFEDVAVAKEAVMMLIDGARHASVYRFLEKMRAQSRNVPWTGESPNI